MREANNNKKCMSNQNEAKSILKTYLHFLFICLLYLFRLHYWCLIFLYSFTNYHLWATYVNFITLTYSYLSEKICPIAVCSWILLHWCYNHFLPITTMFFCVFFICFMFLTQSKVIYTKYSKHQPYIVAHTIDCVCRKCWIMV